MFSSGTVAHIALPVPVPREFDYLAPEGHHFMPTDIGRRVRVPFGSRHMVGIVVGLGPANDLPPGSELRAIECFLDAASILDGELMHSLRWLAHYTHAPLGEVLATALPVALRRGAPLPDLVSWGWTLTSAGQQQVTALRPGGRPRQFAEHLKTGTVAEDQLILRMTGWRAAARNLAQRGLAERVPVLATSGPRFQSTAPTHPLTLNPEQQAASETLAHASGFAPFLLDGITGSGKTEVYLAAIAQCLARAKQALILVPEIGLTPQMLERFRQRLGVPIHVLHSGLNDNERARAWLAAQRGDARVIIGTRSAIFTPLPDAGLIVVDEEHDAGYKQQDGIRYHARDFALIRAKALRVPIVLGSATPALESLHNAATGRYRTLRLRARAGQARSPRVRIVDIRKRPLHAALAPETLDAIDHALTANGQVLVFKNRRGYAPILFCHDCGWRAQCPRCDAPLTVHGGGEWLICHHCGQRQHTPPACPDCASLMLQPQGVGTERLEEYLSAQFSAFPVIRADRATTQRKDGLAKLIRQLGDRPGIWVGTQILAKGHDLPNLTLVVVVGVDEGLFSLDFRAGEKLAQQLVQVAGRAGRSDRAGEVWWQTHHPDHPLLQNLIQGGYPAVAEAELPERLAAGFPPFTHLALFRTEARHPENGERFLRNVKKLLEHHAAHARTASDALPTVSMLGPVAAPMTKRAGLFRSQLLLSATTRLPLHTLLDTALPEIHALSDARKTRWSLDIDPIDLY